MRKIIFLVLVLVMCAAVVLAQNAPPPDPPGGPPRDGTQRGNRDQFQRSSFGGMMGGGGPVMSVMPPSAQMVSRFATPLSLTQEQQDKLTAILTKSDADLAPLRQKLTEAGTALRNAVLAPTYDATKVNTALTAANKAEADVITAQLKTWADVRGVLTADQQAKLSTAMSQRAGFGSTRPGSNRPGTGYGNRPGGENTPPVPPPAPAEPPPPVPAT